MIIGATPRATGTSSPSPRLSTTSTSSVFYSAYMPVSDSALLLARDFKPPPHGEHRLYQADGVMFYHFRAEGAAGRSQSQLQSPGRPQVLLGAEPPGVLPGGGQPGGLRGLAAGAGHRGDLRPAHPGCPPVRVPHLCGAEKAGGGAQAGPVFPHLRRQVPGGLGSPPTGCSATWWPRSGPCCPRARRSSSPSSSRRVRRRPWTGHRFPMPMTAALPAF